MAESGSQGRIQEFHWARGGGGDYYACTHITSAKPNVPYGRGPGPSHGGAHLFLFLCTLSCFLSLIFKHSDTKWDKTKQSRSNFKGVPAAFPSGSATGSISQIQVKLQFLNFFFSEKKCNRYKLSVKRNLSLLQSDIH